METEQAKEGNADQCMMQRIITSDLEPNSPKQIRSHCYCSGHSSTSLIRNRQPDSAMILMTAGYCHLDGSGATGSALWTVVSQRRGRRTLFQLLISVIVCSVTSSNASADQ